MNTPQYRKPRVLGLTSGPHKLLMVYLSHILLAGRASSSGTSQIMFSLLMDPYHTFVPLGVEVASTNPLSCARTCLYRYNTCFSFSINDTLKTCKLDMGGNLYTVKSQEKLSILWEIVAAERVEFWVGLDDLSSVGVWRWADDGTDMADSWGPVIFATGEPSSPGVEDCVEYQPRIQGLNDAFCSLQSRYLCEMKYRLL
ncbi:CD209 antigen-like protein E [Physella acuta]|uniref:CD209 antigen-like protein E n=1 Tax=Physella acuta TaxID=109671 RepID=UPI0027DE3553|nr:CD209 antigen-like protein E [Physella acuta]